MEEDVVMSEVRRIGGLVALGLVGCAGPPPEPAQPTAPVVQTSGTESLLQSVSVVDDRLVWVSGHDGMVLRTENGGESWSALDSPAGDSLQFRDVHGFSANEGVILSSGTGADSRIYRTSDGGATWGLSFLMDHPEGFLDCLDFWDTRGFAYGDAVDGSPYVLMTEDGGVTWRRADAATLPGALAGEGGFAASGTCARTGTGGTGWIATGASGAARVLRTADYGGSWTATDVPVVRGDAAGLTTISFRADNRRGVAFGGDLANMEGRTDNAVYTTDGGASWEAMVPPSFVGPVYGSAIIPGDSTAVAVGPSGAAYTRDGLGWNSIDSVSYWAVDAAPGGSVWMVGPGGRIVRVDFR